MANEIITKVDQGVLLIEINRPEKKNALTQSMYRSLNQAIDTLNQSDDLVVGLIYGAGNTFTAGNDLSDFVNSKTPEDLKDVQDFLLKLGTINKPFIAAIEGPAVGIGSTILPHCDLAYASESAYFQMPFVDIGICVEAGSSVLLPELIGHHRAAECLLLGERLSAQKAYQYGLINEVIKGSVVDYALEKAKMLCSKPKDALLATKQLLTRSKQEAYPSIVQQENKILFELLHSESTKKILESFFKK